MQVRVEALQRHHADLAADQGLDPLHAGGRALDRGDAGHPDHHTRRPDLVSVQARPHPARRVDHQIDLTRCDHFNTVDQIGARRRVLSEHNRLHSVTTQHFRGSLGGIDHEAEIREPLDRKDHRTFVTVGHRDEHPAVGGQRGIRRRLRLGISGAEARVDAHDLAGGLHLGSEYGVHPAPAGVPEPAEGQHRLLHGDVGVHRQRRAVAVRRQQPLRAQLGDGRADHHPGRGLCQRHRRRLRHERHGA